MAPRSLWQLRWRELPLAARHLWWWKLHWHLWRSFQGINPFRRVDGVREKKPWLTYGETPPASTLEVLRVTQLSLGCRVVDLGSGRGKMAMTAACMGFPATGIEYFSDYVERSRTWAKSLKVPAKFVAGDIVSTPLPHGSLFYVASTAFPMWLRETLKTRFYSLQAETQIVTHDWYLPGPEFELLESRELPVGWGSAEFCFHRRRGNRELEQMRLSWESELSRSLEVD